jgi:hypothetical protein
MSTRPQNLQDFLSTLTPEELTAAKSHLLHIFRTNPWLSRIYLGALQIAAPKINKTQNLRSRSVKISNPDSKGTNSMPLSPTVRLCSHIKVNGIPCGSPALHGEVFCYFHQRMIRGVRTPDKSRLHPVALIEDGFGIQASLMEVINALIRNTIDFRRAQLVLRALHIAARNSPNARFDIFRTEMVQSIPNYPAAPEPNKPPSLALAQAGALARLARRKPVSIAPPSPTTAAAVDEPARRSRKNRA